MNSLSGLTLSNTSLSLFHLSCLLFPSLFLPISFYLSLSLSLLDFIYSFIKKCMAEFVGVRSMFLGTFSVKPKYKKMMEILGYVVRFRGTLKRELEFLKEHPEHYDRVSKFSLEKPRSGKDCNGENKDMCELQRTKR